MGSISGNTRKTKEKIYEKQKKKTQTLSEAMTAVVEEKDRESECERGASERAADAPRLRPFPVGARAH